MNKITLLFIVSIIVGIATLAYLTAPADAVTSRLGSDLRSSSFADLAVDSASSTYDIGVWVRKGAVNISSPENVTGAKLVVNGRNGGVLGTPSGGYTGKYGSAGDAIYAFSSSTNAAISAEQANSSGYSIYATGGKTLVELNDTNTTWSSAAETFTVRNYNATNNNWAKLIFSSMVDGGFELPRAGASISAQFTDHWNYNYPNTDLVFFTSNDDAVPTERMRISSAGTITVSGNKISNLGTPAASTDAATKSYVDSSFVGNDYWKQSDSNLSASSTLWLLAIGTSTPAAKLHVLNSENQTRLLLQNDTAGNAGASIINKNAIGTSGNYLTEIITSGNLDSNFGASSEGWISDYVLEGEGNYGNYIDPAEFLGWRWMVYKDAFYNTRASLTAGGDIDISGIYKNGGTSGSTTSCSGGQVLDGQVTSGGIVTGGTCQTRGDITGVSAGTGLTGGSQTGSASLSLDTSSYVTFGQGIVTEYRTSASEISSGVLDGLFGSSLPNGFIGVFYDSDVTIEYLVVRVNSGWHWVVLQ